MLRAFDLGLDDGCILWDRNGLRQHFSKDGFSQLCDSVITQKQKKQFRLCRVLRESPHQEQPSVNTPQIPPLFDLCDYKSDPAHWTTYDTVSVFRALRALQPSAQLPPTRRLLTRSPRQPFGTEAVTET